MQIENIILQQLLINDDYARDVLPFLKEEYFEEESHSYYIIIKEFIEEYNTRPTKEVITIQIDKLKLNSDDINLMHKFNDDCFDQAKIDIEYKWLINETENFCKESALNIALWKSVEITKGEENNLTKEAIPEILSDALAVSFDTRIGHNYTEEAESRYKFYTDKENKIPFHIDKFNKITNGGVGTKTLNIVLGGTNVGKTLILCDFAGNYAMQGNDVLYITGEMSEENISKRIDANLLNVNMNDLENLSKELYMKKIDNLKNKMKGRIVVKEYPTSSAHVGHFRHLLKELRLKQKFIPKVIVVDYINIFLSSKLKMGNNINTNTYVKTVAEEFRGLAVERDIILWTATQTNRKGFTSSDIGLEDTAESFGLPQTADFMFAAMTNETLMEMGQYVIKQLKNRYDQNNIDRKFLVGVDYPKMRIYDINDDLSDQLSNIKKSEDNQKQTNVASFNKKQENNKYGNLST
jgi:archaellum biogenesis ATPase FlaH